jgi:hypothetical protein
MEAANEMKAILLEILEQAFQPADVTATQQMGVQMSNSVREKGVVIIQNQNVEVYARIMPSMVRALRLCDSFEPAVAIAYEPDNKQKELESSLKSQGEIIGGFCKWLFDHNYPWDAAQEIFKDHYLSYVLGLFKTKREAAEFLGVGPTYLSKLTANKEMAE